MKFDVPIALCNYKLVLLLNLKLCTRMRIERVFLIAGASVDIVAFEAAGFTLRRVRAIFILGIINCNSTVSMASLRHASRVACVGTVSLRLKMRRAVVSTAGRCRVRAAANTARAVRVSVLLRVSVSTGLRVGSGKRKRVSGRSRGTFLRHLLLLLRVDAARSGGDLDERRGIDRNRL